MKYYIDECEVSEKVFDMVLRLEGALLEEDTSKYLSETKEQLLKYGLGIYNNITKLTFKIKKEN